MAEACVIGKRYKTRFGWVTLCERNVKAVEAALVAVPAAIARPAPGSKGVDLRMQPDLAAMLAHWREGVEERLRARARGGAVRVPAFAISSAYRRLGTTAGSGKFEDPCGAIDSTDGPPKTNGGHWSGWAIDVPTRFLREACVPFIKIEEVNEAGLEAGLWRPWYHGPELTSYPEGYGEWWHWTPRR